MDAREIEIHVDEQKHERQLFLHMKMLIGRLIRMAVEYGCYPLIFLCPDGGPGSLLMSCH